MDDSEYLDALLRRGVVSKLRETSPELSAWAERQFIKGRDASEIKEAFEKALKDVGDLIEEYRRAKDFAKSIKELK